MKAINDLKIKIFSDGANIIEMKKLYKEGLVKGFTTNPTLMHKEGIVNYEEFAKDVLKTIPDMPISFEVFSDDLKEMEKQALKINSWGKNVFVKIPIMNTQRVPSYRLIRNLSSSGIKVNVTAVMTLEQVREAAKVVSKSIPSYISVFAGRIADTGRDPVPMMADAVEILKANSLSELIWASPRELLNIFQADAIGCHVITVTGDILKKISLVGYDLDEHSLGTVKMFYRDAQSSNFKI